MADDITTLLFKLSADVSNFQKDLRQAKSDIIGTADAAQKSESAFDGMVSKMSGLGEVVAGFGAALAGIGSAAIKAGLDFDEAFDNIQNKTGASGEALASLQESARNIFKDMPVSINQAGEALTILHQRLGLNGPEAENLAKTVLNLSRVTGEDLSTALNNSTRLFGDWGIKTEEAGKAMDFVFNAARASGAKFNEVSETMVKFGSPLRQMGFDFQQTATMIAKFTAEGVEVDKVLAGLRKALLEMGKKGISGDANDALKMFFDQIKAAPTEIKAATIAAELFGAKAGPDMAAAIREGRFELDAMVKKIQDMPGGIDAAAKSTDGFQESLTRFRNQLMSALEPLGTKALDALQENLVPIMDKVVVGVGAVADAFKSLPGPVQAAVAAIAGIGGAFAAIEGVGAAMGAMGLSAGALSGALAPLGIAVAAVAAAFAAWKLGEWAYKTFPAFKGAVDNVVDGFKNVWSAIQPFTAALGVLAAQIVKLGIAGVAAEFERWRAVLGPLVEGVVKVAGALAQWTLDRIAGQIRDVTDGMRAWVGLFKNMDSAKDAIKGVDDLFAKLFASSKTAGEGISHVGAESQKLGNNFATMLAKMDQSAKATVELKSKFSELAIKLSEGKITQEQFKEGVEKLEAAAKKASAPGGGLNNYKGGLVDVDKAAKEAKKSQEEFERAMGVFGMGVDGAAKKVSEMKQAILVLNGALNDGKIQPEQYQKAVKLLFDEMAKAEFAANPLVQALKDIGVHAKPAGDDIPKLRDAIKTLNDGFAAGLVAPSDYLKKLDELETQIRDLENPLGTLEPLVKKLNEAFSAGKTDLEALTAGSSTAADEITRLGQASANAALLQAASTVQMVEAEKAAKALGVTLASTTKKNLDEALASYNKLAESGVATPQELERAWLAYEKKRIEAAIQTGEQITAEDQKTLERAKSITKAGLSDQAADWKKFGAQVSTIVTDLGKSLADVILDGGKVGDVFEKAAQQIGKAFLRYIFEDAIGQIRKGFQGMNLDLGNIFNAIGKAAESLANKIKGLFGGLNLGGGGSTPSLPGGGGGGGTGGIGGALGANPVGAITGIVDAIFGGLQYFQGRRMEKDIGRIEVTTRGQLNEALNLRDDLWTQHGQIMTKMDEMLRDLKVAISQVTLAIRDGQPDHPPPVLKDIKDNTEETAENTEDVKDATEDVEDAVDESARSAKQTGERTAQAVDTVGEQVVSSTAGLTGAVGETTTAVQQVAGAVTGSAEQNVAFQAAMKALQERIFGHEISWAEEQRLAFAKDSNYFKYLEELQKLSQEITGGPVYSLLDSTATATAAIAGSSAAALPRLQDIGSGLGVVSTQIGGLAGVIANIAHTTPGSVAPQLPPQPFIPQTFVQAVGGSDRGGTQPIVTTPTVRGQLMPGSDRGGPNTTTALPLNPTTNAVVTQTNSLRDLQLAAQLAAGIIPQQPVYTPTAAFTPGANGTTQNQMVEMQRNLEYNRQLRDLENLRAQAQRLGRVDEMARIDEMNRQMAMQAGLSVPGTPTTVTGGAGPLSAQSGAMAGTQVGGGNNNTLNVTVHAATTDGRQLAQTIADYVQQSGVLR